MSTNLHTYSVIHRVDQWFLFLRNFLIACTIGIGFGEDIWVCFDKCLKRGGFIFQGAGPMRAGHALQFRIWVCPTGKFCVSFF